MGIANMTCFTGLAAVAEIKLPMTALYDYIFQFDYSTSHVFKKKHLSSCIDKTQ